MTVKLKRPSTAKIHSQALGSPTKVFMCLYLPEEDILPSRLMYGLIPLSLKRRLQTL